MDYLAKLKDIDQQIKALQDEHFELRKDYVIAESPVQVGDIVEVNGYSHAGKKMTVTHVGVKYGYFNEYRFKATGKVLKKDGSVGSHRGEWLSDKL